MSKDEMGKLLYLPNTVSGFDLQTFDGVYDNSLSTCGALTEAALLEAAESLRNGEWVYEPILVSPLEMQDESYMAWLRLNFPNGMRVWRQKEKVP